MKKIAFTLLVVLNLTFFPNWALAQNQPLACQVEKSAGLKWERGRWVTTSFNTKKFILVQKDGNTLTVESVTKAWFGSDSYASQSSCKTSVMGHILCADLSGNSLFFNPKNLKGGISALIGSIEEGDTRDTVSVDVFSCTPY